MTEIFQGRGNKLAWEFNYPFPHAFTSGISDSAAGWLWITWVLVSLTEIPEALLSFCLINQFLW